VGVLFCQSLKWYVDTVWSISLTSLAGRKRPLYYKSTGVSIKFLLKKLNELTNVHSVMQTVETQTHIESIFSIEAMLDTMQRVSRYTALIQMMLLLAITFTGTPGLYMTEMGMMYVSDNFCTKPALGTLFIIMTLPIWVVLTCSLALEPSAWKRRCLLFIMSLPTSTGLGIVFFSLCETHYLHYAYVNTFVLSVGGIHLALTLTTEHIKFLQSYYILLIGSSSFSLVFVIFAGIETGPGVARNMAVIMEYLSVVGFILLNSLSADRIREHIRDQG
jgi:hypothetical protein